MKNKHFLKHCGFISCSRCVTGEELLALKNSGGDKFFWIIILITVAADKGECSFNLDVYVCKYDILKEDLLELIREELKREELLVINCKEPFSGQTDTSQMFGKKIISR